jgi:hypothetical protein
MGQRGAHLVDGRADRVVRRRNAVTLHELLGEGLARLKLSRGASRTKRTPAAALKFIDHTQGKRQLWSDNSQPRLHPFSHGNQRIDAFHIGRQAFGLLRDPTIAGSAVDLGHTRGLAQLPNQSVLASATTDDKDIHSSGQTRLGIGVGDVKRYVAVSPGRPAELLLLTVLNCAV